MARFDQKAISLLEVLKKSNGFDGALLTTFNAYLPFVEAVVLRRLWSAGCNYVVALMDSRQLGEQLVTASLRPSLAGRRYGLLPIDCGGVFHPKILMLIGPRASRIFIGSHNLTMSGFIHNREVTNQIDVKGPKDREGAAVVMEVLEFCRAWSEQLPDALKGAIDPLEAFSRPYRGPVPEDASLKVVGSRPDGASLWQRVRPLLPKEAKRVTFLGPFYDDKLSFVSRVMADLEPESGVVGLDPASATFPGDLKRLPRGLKVINAHDLDPGHKGRGYLHGKAILIESKAGNYLVSGSANPTAAAWLKPANSRNAELVVVRKLTRQGGDDLGLGDLWSMPVVPRAAVSRMRARAESVGIASDGHLPLVGVRDGDHVRIQGIAGKVHNVIVRDADHTELACAWKKTPSELLVDVGEEIDEASTFEVVLGNARRIGFIHHGSLLREEASPSSQRRLREAIGGFAGDPNQLQDLLRLVDKVIFDAPAADRAHGRKRAPNRSNVQQEEQVSTAGLVETIARDKRRERHRLSSGDIGLLMDVLMRRLWRNLSHEQVPGTRSEIELIDSDDDDDGESGRRETTDRDVANAWHRKSRTLLKRLERRICEADDAAQVVMETAAVLGVLEALRRVEEQDRWKSLRLEFVDRAQAEAFAMAALHRLLQPETGLLDAAKAEVGSSFVEEAALIEWVTWLAWLTGFGPDAWDQVDAGDELGEDYTAPTEVADRLARACLIGARQAAADPQRIVELLEGTPFLGYDPHNWLRALSRLGKACEDPASAARLARAPALGDLVMTDRGTGPFVVHRVRADKADVIDFSREEGLVTYKLSGLQVLDAGMEHLRHAVGWGVVGDE